MIIALPILVVVASLAGDNFTTGRVAAQLGDPDHGSWVVFIWGLNLTIPLWPAFGSDGLTEERDGPDPQPLMLGFGVCVHLQNLLPMPSSAPSSAP